MLACVAVTAACLALICTYPDNLLLYNFLSLPIVLAGVLLTIRAAALMCAAVIVASALLVALPSNGLPPPAQMAAISELAVLAALIVLIGHHRNREEFARRRSLAQSEQNLRALADNASNGILVSFRTRHVFANRMAASMVFFRDIRDDQRAQTQMQKLSSAIEQAADAAMITDREGVIEYINPAFTTMTGYSREQAVGEKANLKTSGKQSEAFFRKLWETVLSGEVFSDVFVNRRRDGTLYTRNRPLRPCAIRTAISPTSYPPGGTSPNAWPFRSACSTWPTTMCSPPCPTAPCSWTD